MLGRAIVLERLLRRKSKKHRVKYRVMWHDVASSSARLGRDLFRSTRLHFRRKHRELYENVVPALTPDTNKELHPDCGWAIHVANP